MKNRINLVRILIVVGLATQLVWESALLSRYFLHSETYRPTDFSIFYTAGKIAEAGDYKDLYSIETQREVRESFLGRTIEATRVLPFNHPPILVPILQLITSQDYMLTYWRWILVMLVFLGITMGIIDHLLRGLNWQKGSRALFIYSSLLFYPVFVSLLKGQDTAFLLLGAAIWVYGVYKNKDLMAGAGLALMLIRPQIALFLAIPFLFNRRRVFWWFLAGAVVLTTYSVLLVKIQGVRDFISLLLLSAEGVDYEMFQDVMFNATGLLLRIFPLASLSLIHGLAWFVYVSGIIGSSFLWKKSSNLSFSLLSIAVSLSLFSAPHLHYHDLALLIIPVLCLVAVMNVSGKYKGGIILGVPILISLLLLVSDFWDPLRFTTPFLLMVALPALTWNLEKGNEKN